MDVLITGGTGFIGSRLALRCLDAGLSVRALGLERGPVEAENRRRIEDAGGEVMIGSVTSRSVVAAATDGAEVVFHLAAVQHEMNVPDETFHAVNVEGTGRMVRACREAGAKRFVHGSTIGVYGDAVSVSEDSRADPDDIYGATKLAGEEKARSAAGELPLVVVRIPEVYGPGDRRLLKLFRGVRNGTFPMLGSGENLHHPIYVDDLLEGLMLAARHPRAVGDTFLVPGREVLTTRDMVHEVADAVDATPPRLRLPLEPFVVVAVVLESILRPLGIQPPLHGRRLDFFRKSFRVESGKMHRLLGFEAETSFRDGARRTAEWYRREGLL